VHLLFWLSLGLLFYIYFGYPLALKIFSSKKTSPQRMISLPTVTIVIPAFNEQNFIGKTIQNKIDQDYPSHLIDIIVVSDESTDATDSIVKSFEQQHSNIKLLRQAPRRGKTSGLNLALNMAKGEIVVFSDANSLYQKNAIKEMVNCFANESVGYVTGKMVYVNSDGSLVGDGCSAYMKYENYLRQEETRIGSIVGVDGGIDAIRKIYYQPMNPDQLPDFVLPLKVVQQGKDVVFCETAILHEDALSDTNAEFRMRVRVSLRAYWAMWDMRALFNPKKYGKFSWQLFSHKLLRYMAFVPMIILFISNSLLINESLFYAAAFIGQVAFYTLALLAHYSLLKNNLLTKLAHYFCITNLASTVAFTMFLQGKKIVLWKPRVG
jgi:cellulose synthase/poly-beta-1,6-N-acetylglucosamine synthase-like glycosyltransferase